MEYIKPQIIGVTILTIEDAKLLNKFYHGAVKDFLDNASNEDKKAFSELLTVDITNILKASLKDEEKYPSYKPLIN
jgi:hypothetical protein